MIISIIDGSNYFKGLLILIRKDRKIHGSEILLMERIGKALGFEREFCTNAIRNIMENEYISDKVPEFSTKELASKFIIDGLNIAYADGELHPSEEQWLQLIAEKHKIDNTWFAHEKVLADGKRQILPLTLEVDDITVKY